MIIQVQEHPNEAHDPMSGREGSLRSRSETPESPPQGEQGAWKVPDGASDGVSGEGSRKGFPGVRSRVVGDDGR